MKIFIVLIFFIYASSCAPVYKKLQPKSKITVLDIKGAPIYDAEVILHSNAKPVGFERSREIKSTNYDGMVSFDSKREWRVETILLHGSEYYFWNWCVTKTGYETFVTNHSSANDFEKNMIVNLIKGLTTPCPNDVHFRVN
ncbi:MAG: carboxypeptidase regulatory-like domain-containing protein [Saccharospirillaceae bacterium]|nr:hypothetical protein [Pseudomonadales bacterium]NRB80435.1 carboxypeptidase regulatory-like domain-containing protein [Saccharospirillaceae bacterium]